MANELQQILDEIKEDKNTNLKPENLKAGITCLGVEGTLSNELPSDLEFSFRRIVTQHKNDPIEIISFVKNYGFDISNFEQAGDSSGIKPFDSYVNIIDVGCIICNNRWYFYINTNSNSTYDKHVRFVITTTYEGHEGAWYSEDMVNFKSKISGLFMDNQGNNDSYMSVYYDNSSHSIDVTVENLKKILDNITKVSIQNTM